MLVHDVHKVALIDGGLHLALLLGSSESLEDLFLLSCSLVGFPLLTLRPGLFFCVFLSLGVGFKLRSSLVGLPLLVS